MSDIEGPNVYDVLTFCERNGIQRTTFYRAVKDGHIVLTKIYGKAVVLAEHEADFRKKVADGKLATPRRKPPRRKREIAQQPGAAA